MTDTPTDQSENNPSNYQEKSYWIDDMKNVRKIFWALVILCAVLVLTDLVVHKHTTFLFQEWFGFFGFFGFIFSFILVLTSKQLRRIVMRDEDYYDK